MAKKRRDGLSDDDLRLWWRVTQSVSPLPGRRVDRGTAGEAPANKTPNAVVDEPPQEAPKDVTRLIHKPLVDRPRVNHHSLLAGELDGVDRRLGQRLKRGQLPIEARLDLHGRRRDDAHMALNAFLGDAQARGIRCVLIITGKGRRTPLEEPRSVLKAMLPRWLNEPPNRNRILAFAHARPQHGGEGAYYVLLRKGHR